MTVREQVSFWPYDSMALKRSIALRDSHLSVAWSHHRSLQCYTTGGVASCHITAAPGLTPSAPS